VAECALLTLEAAFGLKLGEGWDAVVGKIMLPDKDNRAAYDKIPHRLDSWGERELLRHALAAQEIVKVAPKLDPPAEALLRPPKGVPDVLQLSAYNRERLWESLAWVIHLTSDFCCLPHYPNLRKDRYWERNYEQLVDVAAQAREPGPSLSAVFFIKPMLHLQGENAGYGTLSPVSFLRENSSKHMEVYPDRVESKPANDLEQAIFCASALCLGIFAELMERPAMAEVKLYRPDVWEKRLALILSPLVVLSGPLALYWLLTAPYLLIPLVPLYVWWYLALDRPAQSDR